MIDLLSIEEANKIYEFNENPALSSIGRDLCHSIPGHENEISPYTRSGVDTGRGEIFYGEGLAYLTLY